MDIISKLLVEVIKGEVKTRLEGTLPELLSMLTIASVDIANAVDEDPELILSIVSGGVKDLKNKKREETTENGKPRYRCENCGHR